MEFFLVAARSSAVVGAQFLADVVRGRGKGLIHANRTHRVVFRFGSIEGHLAACDLA
jgi:hypothetical protein